MSSGLGLLLILFVAGLVAVCVGVWWIYPPAGLILAGATLAAVSGLVARRTPPPARRP